MVKLIITKLPHSKVIIAIYFLNSFFIQILINKNLEKCKYFQKY